MLSYALARHDFGTSMDVGEHGFNNNHHPQSFIVFRIEQRLKMLQWWRRAQLPLAGSSPALLLVFPFQIQLPIATRMHVTFFLLMKGG